MEETEAFPLTPEPRAQAGADIGDNALPWRDLDREELLVLLERLQKRGVFFGLWGREWGLVYEVRQARLTVALRRDAAARKANAARRRSARIEHLAFGPRPAVEEVGAE